MATYDQLVADLNTWLARDDLGPVAPQLIQLAENKHTSEIRIRAMTKRSRTFGNGTRYVALPFGYLDMRRLWYISAGTFRLDQVSPEGLAWTRGVGENPSRERPSSYAVHEELEFDSEISTESELEMLFWSKFTPLSQFNQTNWLSDNAYGVYLYGSLIEAAPYIEDDERLGVWKDRYADHLNTLIRSDARSRTGGRVRQNAENFIP